MGLGPRVHEPFPPVFLYKNNSESFQNPGGPVFLQKKPFNCILIVSTILPKQP
jgi:hypothetical protein